LLTSAYTETSPYTSFYTEQGDSICPNMVII